jgi:hypothetical protein
MIADTNTTYTFNVGPVYENALSTAREDGVTYPIAEWVTQTTSDGNLDAPETESTIDVAQLEAENRSVSQDELIGQTAETLFTEAQNALNMGSGQATAEQARAFDNAVNKNASSEKDRFREQLKKLQRQEDVTEARKAAGSQTGTGVADGKQ